MARYPGAVWRPVPNHGGPMTARRGVTIHITTNVFSPAGWFTNPSSQASSTFWIGQVVTGKCGCRVPRDICAVEQYVETGTRAWAQGAGNWVMDSVETSGMTGTPMTAPQIHTFAHLYVWGSTSPEPGWPRVLTDDPNGAGFGWHGMGGAAWGGHVYCPGDARKAQRAEVLAQTAEIINERTAPTTTAPLGDDDMPYTPAELTSIVANAVAAVLRTEGVSGAGDPGNMLRRGYSGGIATSVATVLRSEGVSGAGDRGRLLEVLQPAIAEIVRTEVRSALADGGRLPAP